MSEVEHFDGVEATPVKGGSEEAKGLADELRVIFEGDAWHGPALAELLAGVPAERAAARPLRGAHTLWELVLHVTAWTNVWRRRLDGEPVDEPEEGDFPKVPPPTPSAWAEAQARLRSAHERLVERVARLREGDLAARVPGRDYTARFLVRGAIRHTVYHSGQIGILRKPA